jgi:hypothetical protein
MCRPVPPPWDLSAQRRYAEDLAEENYWRGLSGLVRIPAPMLLISWDDRRDIDSAYDKGVQKRKQQKK